MINIKLKTQDIQTLQISYINSFHESPDYNNIFSENLTLPVVSPS